MFLLVGIFCHENRIRFDNCNDKCWQMLTEFKENHPNATIEHVNFIPVLPKTSGIRHLIVIYKEE